MERTKSCIYPFEKHAIQQLEAGASVDDVITSLVPRYKNLEHMFIHRTSRPLHGLVMRDESLSSIVRYEKLRLSLTMLPTVNDIILFMRPIKELLINVVRE